jgi:stage II sporulation protein R
MKLKMKSLGITYILMLAIGTILSLYIPKNEVIASEAIVIPKEAIRLRILANSDLEEDQSLKRLVRDEVNANITKWVQELTSINDARSLIQSKLPEVQAIAEAVAKKEGSTQSINVEFGKVPFPTKLYGQFLYPAGEYEAILITLGEGKGANWWCVLFPPLCFLDFSSGVAVSDGFEGEANTVQSSVAEPKTETVKEEAIVQMATAIQEPIQHQSAVQESVEHQSVVQEEPLRETTTPSIDKQPVYVTEVEQKVEVKFFLKELWLKIF